MQGVQMQEPAIVTVPRIPSGMVDDVIVPVGQQVHKTVDQVKVTYGVCIAILILVIVILLIVICIKASQISKAKNPAISNGIGIEQYGKVNKKGKAEKYNQIETPNGIIDYKMLQKDNKIQGQVVYGDNKEHIIHPFMQEYFKNMKSLK